MNIGKIFGFSGETSILLLVWNYRNRRSLYYASQRDAQIHGQNINQIEKVLNTFQPGTLAIEMSKHPLEIWFSKHISYLKSFRKRIQLSSLDETSILIDSKISGFCRAISEAIFNNTSEMDYTDLDFLTKLLLISSR